MQKRLIEKLSILIFFCCSSLAAGANYNHLADLKLKFPYGLLGDDQGILSVNDLAINTCGVRPHPFNPTSDHYHPYEYWQCFESKSISFDCDSDGTSDKYEGVMGLIVIKVHTPKDQHEYLEHRLWPIRQCRRFIKDAAALLKGNKYACLSGSFIDSEKNRSGRRSMSWNFERIKTKTGCEGRGCDFNEKFRQDNCPNLKF